MKEDTFCTFILFLERGTMLGPACRFGKEKSIAEKHKKYLIFLIITILLGEGGVWLFCLDWVFFWFKGRLLGVVERIPLRNLTTRLI